MNNHSIPQAFLDGRITTGSNGRGNFRFKGDTLWSYDDIVAVKRPDGELWVNSDVFSSTSSRHQSAIRKVAGRYRSVPDLTALVEVLEGKGDPKKYILRRKLATSDILRRIEASRSSIMESFLRERIQHEKSAAKIAAVKLPIMEATGIFSGVSGIFSGVR